MADYKLTYFDFDGGRGEPIRIALHAAGIEFEDERLAFPEFSAAQPGFRFCFKFPRKITHENNLRYCGVELSDFLRRLEPLGESLGTFMIQLPESFTPEQLPDLQRFLKELPSDYTFSVEVRHRDFFNRGDEEKTLNQTLHDYQVDRVCFDSRESTRLVNSF